MKHTFLTVVLSALASFPALAQTTPAEFKTMFDEALSAEFAYVEGTWSLAKSVAPGATEVTYPRPEEAKWLTFEWDRSNPRIHYQVAKMEDRTGRVEHLRILGSGPEMGGVSIGNKLNPSLNDLVQTLCRLDLMNEDLICRRRQTTVPRDFSTGPFRDGYFAYTKQTGGNPPIPRTWQCEVDHPVVGYYVATRSTESAARSEALGLCEAGLRRRGLNPAVCHLYGASCEQI